MLPFQLQKVKVDLENIPELLVEQSVVFNPGKEGEKRDHHERQDQEREVFP